MVAVIEVAVLLLFTLLFYLWFRGTNMAKAHRRHGLHPGQQGNRVTPALHSLPWGIPPPTPPPAALHDFEQRPRRRWWFARRGD